MEKLNCSIENNKNLLECKTRPKPLTPYFGGKAKVADEIIAQFPEHNTFVEPFVGGGSLYWANTRAEKYVINDLNKDIYTLYRTAKDSPQAVKSCAVNKLNSKEEFDKVRDKSSHTACDVIALHKNAFSGSPKNGFAKKDRPLLNRFGENHVAKLKKTVILNQDFRKVMERYDLNNTAIYLDPPYVKGGDAYNTHGVSPKEVCDAVKKLKRAKAIISYDDSPQVREACKGLKFDKISFLYSSGNTHWGKNITKTELLIKNY